VEPTAATDYNMHDCCGIPTGTKLHAFYFVLWQQVLQVSSPGIYYISCCVHSCHRIHKMAMHCFENVFLWVLKQGMQWKVTSLGGNCWN